MHKHTHREARYIQNERQNTPTLDLRTSTIIHTFLLISLRSSSNANRNLVSVGTAYAATWIPHLGTSVFGRTNTHCPLRVLILVIFTSTKQLASGGGALAHGDTS